MDKYERRRRNLAWLRDTYCDGRNADLARKLGKDPSYISRMFYPDDKAGRKRIADDMLEHIEEVFRLPRFALDSEKLPLGGFSTSTILEQGHKLHGVMQEAPPRYVLGGMEGWDDDTPLDEDDVEVPFFKDVRLAAGSGYLPQIDQEGRKLRFSRATLKAAGVDPANAACATNHGRSMERLILDGATIGIDRGRTQVKDGKIYAIEHAGDLRVKYLYRMPGGGLRLHSENDDEYPDETFGADWPEQIRIIGWVFWWSRLETW